MANSLGTTGRVTVRGRVVEEEHPVELDHARPGKEMSQDEFEDVTVGLTLRRLPSGAPISLGEFKTDHEGYLDRALTLTDKALEAGDYVVEVHLDGRIIGRASVRLLAVGTPVEVVRSDVDLTYLVTDFHSKRAMAKLLLQTARDRRPLPGMPAVYHGLRSGDGGHVDRPLVFISGSPRFFKRTLEGRMELDRVRQDGVFLKPFKELARSRLRGFEPEAIVPALEEQVGFKLWTLLRGRLDLPAVARELLLGDDSECDFIVYNLYHRATAKLMSPKELGVALDDLGVASTWREPILALLPEVLALLDGQPTVVAIAINRTGRPNLAHPVDPWLIEGLTAVHDGAWPLALSLWERGYLSRDAVVAVREGLKGRLDGAVLEARTKEAVEAGLISAERVGTLP